MIELLFRQACVSHTLPSADSISRTFALDHHILLLIAVGFQQGNCKRILTS